MPSYTAEIQTAMAELLRCWNQSHDNLLVASLVTRYGTVYVSAEVTMDRRAKALGLWDVVIYPEMAGAVPRGKLAALFRDFLRDMLVTAECNGFIDISVTAVRTLTSSSARPGHIIGMRFFNGRRTK